MKKIYLFFTVCIFIFSGILHAQNNCNNAIEITSLPFYSTSLTTSGTGNDFSPTDACNSPAMACEDYVFKFTPSENMSIRIALSNTSVVSEIPISLSANIGLFLIKGCPNATGSICVASVDNLQSNPEIAMANVVAGSTYYIVISSELINFIFQTINTNVNFDISVEQVFGKDMQITNILTSGSGCGLTQIPITVVVKNSGTSPINNLDLSYQIDEFTPVVENYSGLINPGTSINYTFLQNADVSSIGTYLIKAKTILSEDQNPSNDSHSITITHTPTISTFPNISDFELNDNYFYAEGTNSSWQHGTPPSDAGIVINQAYSGTKMWATNLSGNANTNETSYLISPCYDLSSLNTPHIHFRLWSQLGIITDFAGTLTLQASIDGGSNYPINIASWNANNNGWTKYEYELAQLQGESNVRFRFKYQGNLLANEGVAIDDFVVRDELMNDVGPGALIQPTNGCGLSSQETIKVAVWNYGALPQSNIPITYSTDGGITWLNSAEIVAGPISQNNFVEYSFNMKADLSNPGSYQIVVKTMLVNDETPENDINTYQIFNTLEINSFPYTESFETENHGWVGSAGSSWARGIPNDTLTINYAYDGEYVMATNPYGNTNFNENSELVSPCFNFSGINGIELSMKVWYETGFMPASIDLFGSNDGGNTWFTIDQTWTGSSGGWITKSFFVNEFLGQSNCKIKIKYVGEFIPSEGVAIDYVQLIPLLAKDVGVVEYIGPANGCALSTNEHFIVKVKNFGSMPQSGFQVQYSLDGGNVWSNQNISGILQPLQTTNVSFSVAVDLSAIDSYDVIFRTNLIGDENPANNALQVTVTHSESISNFPYHESFENGDGDWFTYGMNSSFQHGVPTGTTINYAADGTNCWATNLSGNYNANENSFLQAPCFDFTNMVNPSIKANINYQTAMVVGGFYMQSSINNGQTWDTIKATSNAINWYGSSLMPEFGSTWGGSTEGWIIVSTSMPQLAGYNNVYIRFVFEAGDMPFVMTEGVAVDNIYVYDCSELPEASFEYEINGLTVYFTSTVANADSVLWNFGNNQILPSTSTEINPSFTYNSQGVYEVSFTAYNQCGSTTVTQTISLFTNINSKKTHDIQIYPNPANSLLNIKSNDISGKLSICNIQGQIILTYTINNNITQISLEGFAQGLYLIKIETEEATIVKQLIIN